MVLAVWKKIELDLCHTTHKNTFHIGLRKTYFFKSRNFRCK